MVNLKNIFSKKGDYAEFEEVNDSTALQPTSGTTGKSDLARLFDTGEFAEREINEMEMAISVVNSVTTSISEAVKVVANVRLEIKRLDHELDMFIASSNFKLERFRTAMPVLEKQLTSVSNRIDKITDSMIANVMDAKDDLSIKKHEMLLSMLTDANNSFNNMLTKLINL